MGVTDRVREVGREKFMSLMTICSLSLSLSLSLLTEKKAEEAAMAAQNFVDPMKCSRRPFGGLFADFKTLVQRYPSDIKDFLHTQCLMSIVFTFISCIAPAITFGGLMEEVTHNAIGETETLVGTGVCGMVFGLFSVQPLAILAFTGPLLLFEEIIIDVSVCDVCCFANKTLHCLCTLDLKYSKGML